jgi:type IV pilus assembly protein PilM
VVDTPEGPRQRVVIVAARRESIMRLLSAARNAGLRPEGIDLSAFAMIRALGNTAADAGDAPVLYINLGGLTNLAVGEGRNCTFTRVSSASIGDVIAQLAERRELTLDHARQWLHHVGLITPAEDIDGDPEIVHEARNLLADGSRRIADEIRNSLEFYATQEAARTVERSVLTGPAASIPGLAEELGRTLGLPLVSAAVEAGSGLTGVEPAAVTVAAGLAVTEVPA